MGKTEVNVNIDNITLIDFPNVCRICLSNSNLKLFDKCDLWDLFRNITNIQIVPEDKLPQNVCIACITQLQSIASFITLSINTNTKLTQILIENNFEVFVEEQVPKFKLETDCGDDGTVEPPECFDEYLHGIEKVKLENPENKLAIGVESSKFILEEVKDEDGEEKHIVNKEVITKLDHYEDHSFKCEICGETFNTINQLTWHQKEVAICGTKIYKCTDCEKSFFTKLRLKGHMLSHTEGTPFECKICFKRFKQRKSLNRHDNVVHKELKPFKCDVCGKDFATAVRRTEHRHIHTGERPHICTYCGVGFKKYSTLFAHEKRHKIKNGDIPKSEKEAKTYPKRIPNEKKSFLCNECGKGFIRKSQLEVHIRIHTGVKPYKCNDCGKCFRQSATYRSHLFIHKGEKTYKCEICLRTFKQLGHLQSHLKTHTGEKPYKCTFCGKGFIQNANLKCHTRIHTGERPYKCSVCNMGFCNTTHLKRHKKTHEVRKENECSFK